MIIDQLQNASSYYTLGDRMEIALRYLQEADLSKLTLGRHDIEGDDVFILIQEYGSKSKEEGTWEAHRQYFDVQYVVSGQENMGFANVDRLMATEYDEENDFLPLEGEAGDLIEMQAGTFMILAPQDAHMPGIAIAGSEPVKKAIVKVRI
jgi:YhcH/YjgK/YiaL family protein